MSQYSLGIIFLGTWLLMILSIPPPPKKKQRGKRKKTLTNFYLFVFCFFKQKIFWQHYSLLAMLQKISQPKIGHLGEKVKKNKTKINPKYVSLCLWPKVPNSSLLGLWARGGSNSFFLSPSPRWGGLPHKQYLFFRKKLGLLPKAHFQTVTFVSYSLVM